MADDPLLKPPISTYSIVARDPTTGELGVAVQSHYFSVGSAVPWAESGAGAVATQAFVDRGYGPCGLELMRNGRSATATLAELVAADHGRERRQVAMVDARGHTAAHTGSKCIQSAGHQVGSEYSVQGNLLSNDSIWPAMAAAFENRPGDLAERMMTALEAGEKAGGDQRGRQSAAMLVVRGVTTGRPWDDRVFDLRVEDHREPLIELRRLVNVRRANRHAEAAEAALSGRDFEAAAREFAAARELNPADREISFWYALALANAGRTGDALPILRELFAAEPRWRDLLPRLPKAGLFADDPELVMRILKST